jgi:serine/threonine-protein kinase
MDVIRAIGVIQRRLGHWEKSIDAFRRAIELDPRNIDAYMNLAITYRVLRRFPDCLATLDRLLALEPTNGWALDSKADVFFLTGDFKAAERLLTNPGIEPSTRGWQALFQRRYADAAGLFSAQVAADIKRGEPIDEDKLVLAFCQQRAGDVAAARATYQSAVQDIQHDLEKVTPGSFQEGGPRMALGRAYAGLGQRTAAIAEGQKAVAIMSNDPVDGRVIEEEMAEIYALLGDADHAVPILKRLLEMPGKITPALLRLDPVWDQIRNDPRFQELPAEKRP